MTKKKQSARAKPPPISAGDFAPRKRRELRPRKPSRRKLSAKALLQRASYHGSAGKHLDPVFHADPEREAGAIDKEIELCIMECHNKQDAADTAGHLITRFAHFGGNSMLRGLGKETYPEVLKELLDRCENLQDVTQATDAIVDLICPGVIADMKYKPRHHDALYNRDSAFDLLSDLHDAINNLTCMLEILQSIQTGHAYFDIDDNQLHHVKPASPIHGRDGTPRRLAAAIDAQAKHGALAGIDPEGAQQLFKLICKICHLDTRQNLEYYL